MFGQNPKRSPTFNDGTNLEVKSIFKTIQGEGPFVGTPAVFIRLGGCNLACSFCDTDFEEFNIVNLQEIIKNVLDLSLNFSKQRVINLVVITGGEPFRQSIELLCDSLVKLKFTVQIETNGTLYRNIAEQVQIVCSPKVIKNRYLPLREDLLPRLQAIKFLVAKNVLGYSQIPELGQSKYNIPVFVQPMDQNNHIINQENEQFAVNLALNYGYRLSLQTHKILGID
ncbi:7-carboxy-7-deazaguanine synthase QueE [Candidatus Tisiphia endosymbiont of Beris chalybata]|uniref:7-carboxy-7-deazaguanine synthase QueE n=1 Tax=Candidatus Tisiphia endosymbiont of Beris chalybata TaxID=3066262 RepID=UPI00312C7848